MEGGRRAEAKANKKKTYLNMIRMYVTWSIPLSWTYCSSSSVADINNRPAATKSYRDFVASAFSFEKKITITITMKKEEGKGTK